MIVIVYDTRTIIQQTCSTSPSTTVALSPIAFAALHAWKTQKMHTVSVGFARASDLDEVVDAARMFADNSGKADALLKAAESKLQEIAVDKLGKDWHEKGLLNVPSFYTESSDGMALGHMLWLHNCLKAFGMYEFAKDRYEILEGVTVKWKKKSFEDNKKKCL
jgi:predicted aldo/keto reductase-like oxidoreductase